MTCRLAKLKMLVEEAGPDFVGVLPLIQAIRSGRSKIRISLLKFFIPTC